jgi:hypothetical protein
MNPLVKKLIILGASFTVAAPVIFVACPVVFGLIQGFYIWNMVATNHTLDAQQMGENEFVWIMRLMLFCTIMGATGLLILAAGIIGVFVSSTRPASKSA